MIQEIIYSFIIPHKNCPDLLQRCINSIPKRNDVQIIVVDDNSDESKKPSVENEDVQLILLDDAHSRGAGHARNVGLEYAKGKWLLFADCDDYYESDFLNVLDKYRNRNDIDLVYFNYNYIDSITGAKLEDNKLQKCIENFESTKNSVDIIKFRNNTPWTKMVRRAFVVSDDIQFEEVINGNDVLFSLLVAMKSTIIQVEPTRLYNYIRTPNSLGTRKPTVDSMVCRIIHKVKHSRFNSYIGHEEWNSSIIKYIYGLLRNNSVLLGVYLIIVLFVKSPLIFYTRNEWVSLFKYSQK